LNSKKLKVTLKGVPARPPYPNHPCRMIAA